MVHLQPRIDIYSKLVTYSLSVVKFNFGRTNPFVPLWVRPCYVCYPFSRIFLSFTDCCMRNSPRRIFTELQMC